MARKGEIDCFIINTFDRLSCNQTHLAVLIDEMMHLGIEILCVKEKFDDTAQGQFMRSAMAFVAQVEREKIAERTDTGRRKRISEGKIMPGWKPRYGYKWEGEKKERYTINEFEAAVINKIFRLYAFERGTCRNIARTLTLEGIPSPGGLTVWHDSTVRRILEDPMYIGRGTAFKYNTVSGKHDGKYSARLKPEEEQLALPDGVVPPVLVTQTGEPDRALFQLVQEQLKINQVESPRNNPTPEAHLLRCGFIRCGYCKRSMGAGKSANPARKNPSETNEYRCTYRYRGSRPCKEAPVISIHRIDTAVEEYVWGIAQDFSLVQEAIRLASGDDPSQPDLQSIDHSIKVVKNSQEQLVADLKQADGEGFPKLKGRARQLVIDDLEKSETYLKELQKERLKVIAGQGNWKQMQEDIDIFLEWCLTAKDIKSATYEEKRRALRVLGIQVYVYRGDDEEHDRYEIKVRIPDIVRHKY
jgi:site-specific DNA recombinase